MVEMQESEGVGTEGVEELARFVELHAPAWAAANGGQLGRELARQMHMTGTITHLCFEMGRRWELVRLARKLAPVRAVTGRA